MKAMIAGGLRCALVTCALFLLDSTAFGLGSDYPAGRPVMASTNWPKGLEALVNGTNRVHGFFVNAEDIFFFAGNASELTQFLRDCSALPDVVSRRFIIHPGFGEAKSPWTASGRPCDWKLYICPKGWYNLHDSSMRATNSVEVLRQVAREPGYVLDVHCWTGAHVGFEKVDVPKNFELKRE